MLKIIAIITITFASYFATADIAPGKSARRAPGESYRAYKAFATLLSVPNFTDPAGSTPVEVAKQFGTSELPPAVQWENEEVMIQRFDEMRDHRWMNQPQRPTFPRRISWLYPDDGCFARAGLAVRNLQQWTFPAPSKVFIFGDLNVKTPYAPSGSVSWWYHVAPMVEVNGKKFVLDPSIESAKPLPLEEWLARHTDDISKIEVAVCGSGSYTPYDQCARQTDGIETVAENDQVYFLSAEWDRLVELGRNPREELGDNPPWKNQLQ